MKARTGNSRRIEAEWERRLSISTSGREGGPGEDYLPYEPTPYPVLERLADSGLIGPADHVLDYGCGKGRVALFLAAMTGCRASGIDISPGLIAAAEENLARSGLKDRVSFARCAAEDYDVAGENAFFFFNPFSERILDIVAGRILASGRARPRKMRLFVYYPSEGFASFLAARPGLRPAGEIDCRDLFRGGNPRERIAVFEAGGG